jgi:hypothetical protein
MDNQYDNRTAIDNVLYWQFVKYNTLSKLVYNEYATDDSDVINVYIDLYQILVTIHRYTKINNYFCICAIVINYCAHLRHFFKKLNVYANIVLVYGDKSSTNITQFIPEYNTFYKNRIKSNGKINSVVKSNMELLRKLIPYLPNIYLREGTVESAVIMHDIIQRKLIGVAPSLVISNSLYMYQLPIFSKSVKVIKKSNSIKMQEDTTYSYNNFNALEAYLFEVKNVSLRGRFNQNTLSFIMSILGIPKLSVLSMGVNYKTALRIANNIPIGYEHDCDVIGEVYDEYITKNKMKNKPSVESIIKRFKGIDLGYQYSLYKLLPEYSETSFLNKLEDKDAVHYINNNYFEKCPIYLDEL